MKRLFFLFLVCFVAVQAHSQDCGSNVCFAKMNPYIAGSGVVAASCSSGNEDITPDDNAGNDTWESGQCAGAADNHDCVGGETYDSPNDSNRIHTNGADLTEQYTVSNTASMGSGCTATTIVVYVRGSWATNGNGYVEARISKNNSTYINSTEGHQHLPSEFPTMGWLTFTFSSLTWTKAEVDGMYVRIIGESSSSGSDDYVVTIVARVTYE